MFALLTTRNKIFNIHFENSLTIYSDLISRVHAIGKFSRNRERMKSLNCDEENKTARETEKELKHPCDFTLKRNKSEAEEEKESKFNFFLDPASEKKRKKNIFEARKINHFDLY